LSGAIAVEIEGVVKIAEGDIEVAAGAIPLCGEEEVGVTRFVGLCGRRRAEDGEGRQQRCEGALKRAAHWGT
jgi:hypothetical protein